MRILIDTSSLLAFVKYYRPFDKEDALKTFLKEKIETDIVIVIDKVYEESGFISQGIIINDLDFLKEKKRIFKTDKLLPSKKFFNILDNQLCRTIEKNKLTALEYEKNRNDYLNTADAKLILCCYNESDILGFEEYLLVTEETSTENDNKVFKKLPAICSILKIKFCTLPSLLNDNFKICLSQYLK
jgi:hypothetical protein